MTGSTFDEVAKTLAGGRSRRSVVRGLIGGGAALAAARTTSRAALPAKVSICHVTDDPLEPYILFSLPERALRAHAAHGDFEPFDCDGVPGCFGSQPLFNCGPGYSCPTAATTFCPGGSLDPTSSDQARSACEACFGMGACVNDAGDCSGAGWLRAFDPAAEPPLGSPTFGYEPSDCGANPQPPGRVYFNGASDPVSDYGYWGLEICP
ncbi:hypothetical protein BH23CHL4_BH23CHL4_12650 [soil metagenome]